LNIPSDDRCLASIGEVAVHVDVHPWRLIGCVEIEHPSSDPDRAGDSSHGVDESSRIDGVVQARGVVVAGAVVDSHGSAASRVDLPRGCASNDPADDRTDAVGRVVAVAISEVDAACLPVAAVVVGAAALGAVA
jgi:hypothetical protein